MRGGTLAPRRPFVREAWHAPVDDQEVDTARLVYCPDRSGLLYSGHSSPTFVILCEWSRKGAESSEAISNRCSLTGFVFLSFKKRGKLP